MILLSGNKGGNFPIMQNCGGTTHDIKENIKGLAGSGLNFKSFVGKKQV